MGKLLTVLTVIQGLMVVALFVGATAIAIKEIGQGLK